MKVRVGLKVLVVIKIPVDGTLAMEYVGVVT
jgi:hypothetical protein